MDNRDLDAVVSTNGDTKEKISFSDEEKCSPTPETPEVGSPQTSVTDY